jgi:hypothetical protein
MIFDLGASLGIKNHPICRRAAVLLRLNEASLSRVLLSEAIATGNAYSAATETIKLKRAFLRLPEVQEEYSIEKFKRLRSSSDFSMRLALESSELKHSMLRHTDGLIGTSLTVLSPVLAALAVIIFTHTIKVLEESSSQYPEVLLRNLLNVGRSCPVLRDEILMQCVKQLRENPFEDSEMRIWVILKACLKHFPPSEIFENYLEVYLLSQIKMKPDLRTILAANCIRNMHETIFRYGYHSKIFVPWDSSLSSVKGMLQAIQKNEPILQQTHPSNHTTTGSHHKNSSSTAVTGSASSSSSSSSSSRPLQQTFYSFLDPAFVMTSPNTSSTNTTNTSSEGGTGTGMGTGGVVSMIDTLKLSSQISVRGTRDNWISRFHQFSQDEEDISMAEFYDRIFSSTSKIDRNDRIVFLFWVCKYLPSKGTALSILRELSSDKHLFYSTDTSERNSSKERKELVRNLPNSDKSLRLETQDAKLAAVKSFWMNVICVCVSFEIVQQQKSAAPGGGTGTGGAAGSGSGTGGGGGTGSAGNQQMRRSPTRPTILSHSMSDVGGFSNDLLPRNNTATTSHLATLSMSDLPSVPIEEAYITWPVYRDVILVGMERIALEYEQLQEKSVNQQDLFLTKNLKRTPSSSHGPGILSSSPRTISPSPPPTNTTATAGGAAQRQRRNASHNKLPL